MKGRVVRLVLDRGFGFVRSDVGATEFFFHRGSVINGRFEDLVEGDPVEFTEAPANPKGPRVQTLERAAAS